MRFEEFDQVMVPTAAGRVSAQTGGVGPAVLLLHGIPQTKLMWHRVAPALAEAATVVATDLRGYGNSEVDRRPEGKASAAMSDLAAQQVEVMSALGHERFAVVGHDRGARCAYRMAVDHPERVSALSVLDIVPTGDAYERADARFAAGFWVWSFLGAPAPVPERLIAADPDFFVDHLLDTWADDKGAITEPARAAYRRTFHDPARVHEICEQYRAAVAVDVAADLCDRERVPITCPVLALWSSTGAVADWYDPLAVWRGWAGDVRGRAIAAGHFLAEEAPAEMLTELVRFLDEAD